VDVSGAWITVKGRLLQAAIAFDQFINCLVSLFIGGGWADETISARMWRNRAMPWWREARWLVDKLFWGQPNHCYQSFVSELQRKQLPEDYQEGSL